MAWIIIYYKNAKGEDFSSTEMPKGMAKLAIMMAEERGFTHVRTEEVS